MAQKNFVVAIELGSTKITGIAGQKKSDGSLNVISVVSEDASQCMRKGVVYNIDKTAQCISGVIQRLRGQLHAGIKHVFVGVGGQSLHAERNTIVRDVVPSEPVTMQLLADMADSNRMMNYPDMQIVDVIDLEYNADSMIEPEPVGIECSVLKGNYLNILLNKRHYNKLNTCFANAGVNVADFKIAPVVMADAVLADTEKRGGCMLVDLGAETTTVMVYYRGQLRHLTVIPLGGNNITKDIANVLQMDEKDAENLKLNYASAYTKVEDIDPAVKYNIDKDRQVDAARFVDIVESRMQEIIANVWSHVPEELTDKLLGGIVLTGGASNMPDIIKAFQVATNIDKVRVAKSVATNVISTNTEMTTRNGTKNTILGLLAAGNENCYLQIEDTKPADMFGGGSTIESVGGENTPGNAQPTPAQMTAAKAAEEEAKKKAEEEKRAAEEVARKAAEEEEKSKKPGWGTRIIKALSRLTAEEE